MAAIQQELERQEDVRLAYLFGSRTTGRAAPDSDWDIAILLDRGAALERRLTLADRLGTLLGIRCDVVDLQHVPVEFAARVVCEGRPLLVRRRVDLVEYEATILAMASLQASVLESQRREIMEGGAHGRAVERYRKALGTSR
jgi:predicted nucleotidyltransferase